MLLGSNNYQQTTDKRWMNDNRVIGPAVNNWGNNKTKEISIYQQLPPNPRNEPRWEQAPASNNPMDNQWVNDDDLPDDAKDPWGDDEAAAESLSYQNFDNPGPQTTKQQLNQQWKPQTFQNFSSKSQWPIQAQLSIPLNIPGNLNRWQPEATNRNNPAQNFHDNFPQQWQQQSIFPQQQQQQQPPPQSHHRGPSTRFF